jgi:hypothetical protein
MLSNQKFALLLFVAAAGLTVLGRWGVSGPTLRERDVFAIFGGGFLAGLAVVRFIAQWRKPAPAAAPTAAPPKSKS